MFLYNVGSFIFIMVENSMYRSIVVWWLFMLCNLVCFYNVIKGNFDFDVIFDKCLLMKVFGVIFFKYVNVLFKFD